MIAATPLQLRQLMDFFQDINPAIMFLLILWSLINCFLGYLIFRILLAVNGLILGGIIGSLILAGCLAAPTAMGGFMAALAGGTLLALLAWFAGRAAFVLMVGFCAVVLVMTAVGWILGILLGLIVCAIVYSHFKPTVFYVTAVTGAAGSIFYAAALAAGRRASLWSKLFEQPGRAWLVVLLLLIAAALAVAGAFVQRRLAPVIRTSLTPLSLIKKRRRSRRGHSVFRPRFSKP